MFSIRLEYSKKYRYFQTDDLSLFTTSKLVRMIKMYQNLSIDRSKTVRHSTRNSKIKKINLLFARKKMQKLKFCTKFFSSYINLDDDR